MKKMGDINISGTVAGDDGAAIPNFNVTVYNTDGEEVQNQNFTNAWTLDPIAGYNYQFSDNAGKYGLVALDGSTLSNGFIVVLPKNVSYSNSGSGSMPLLLAVGALLAGLAIGEKNKKKRIGELTEEEIKPYIFIGGAIAVFFVGKAILTKLGIVESQATTTLNAQSTSPTSFWNPNFYTQFATQSVPLDATQAANDVQTILNAYGFFSTCFACIQGVFNNYQTQSQVSYLASVFSQKEDGADLLTYLRSGLWPFALTDDEVAQLNTYISQLPTN